MVQIPRIHQLGPHLVQTRNPTIPHRHLQLIPHDLQQMLHPLLAIPRRKQRGAAQPPRRRPQRQTLEDVAPAADAAVDVDFQPREDFGTAPVAFEQGEEGGRRGVEVAAAVVGEHDAVQAVFHGEEDVRGGHDALEDQG